MGIRKGGNKLRSVTNIVTSRCQDFTDIYIATAEGEFARFTVPNRTVQGDGLRYKELDLQHYLAETQHHVGCENIKADYASRIIEEGGARE